jgi:2-hydroxy-6-oxonona-2,4-dienedioate hydrolase
MFVWSDHNPTPAAVAEAAFSYLANGPFVLMTDCGHWPQWEDAPTFNRHVMAFLGAEALVAR